MVSSLQKTFDGSVSLPNTSAISAVSSAKSRAPLANLTLAQPRASQGGVSRLVVIDPSVDNLNALRRNVLPGSAVFVLNANQNGIQQISQILAGRTNLNSLHIISKGRSGALQLGNTTVTSGVLNQFRSQIARWGTSLRGTGDIVVYGSNVASGNLGAGFVRQLGQITRRAIAASTDQTGSIRGGDWDLEFSTGAIESGLAIRQTALDSYRDTLDLGNGLRAEYFNTINLTGAARTRVDARVNFNWANNPPLPGLNRDRFSVRWTGQIEAPTTDTYRFFLNADNGARLFVNGRQIINNFTRPTRGEKVGAISLRAGQRYDIRVEYFDNAGPASIDLSWANRTVSKQTISQANLFAADAPPPVVEPPVGPPVPPTPGVSSIALAQSSVPTVTEGGIATFTVLRSGDTTGTSTVNYRLIPGTGSAADYTVAGSSLTFAPGQTSQTVSVNIADDLLTEGAESFQFVLENPNGAILGTNSGASVTIAASDPVVRSFTLADFSGPPPFNFNDEAGTGFIGGQTVLQLTTDEALPTGAGQFGTAFYDEANPFAFTADTSFRTRFQFRASGTAGTLADGFTFTIQNTFFAGETTGGAGRGLGYEASGVGSLAVTFDNFQNPDTNDPAANFIGVRQDGLMEGVAPLATNTTPLPFNLANGDVYTAWIDYNGNNNLLSVYLGSATATRPTTPVLTYTVDLPTILNSASGVPANRMFVGFTGSTGGNTGGQYILNWDFATLSA
jgi:hypothetical protein